MPARTLILALLLIAPAVWSMRNENTVLAKSLALGIFAGAALGMVRPARIIESFRHALPAHLLLGTVLTGALLSPSPSFSWPAALFVATLWLTAALAAQISTPEYWMFAVPAAAALPILAGLAQLTGLDPSAWLDLVREHFHGRVCSTLGNPNFFAAFLAGSAPFLGILALSARSAGGRFYSLTLLGLAGAGLIASGSKGGLVGFIAGLAITAVAWIPSAIRSGSLKKIAIYRTLLALLLGAALGLAFLPANIRGRLLMADPGTGAIPSRHESVRFRLLTWQQTLRMIREAPLAGFGIGRFQVIYPRFRPPEIIRMFGQHSYMTDHPENISLEIAAEMGITGLGLWIWLLAFLASILLRKLAVGTPPQRRLAAASAGGLTGLLASNSFGVDIHYGASAVLAACFVGASLARPSRWLAPAAPRLRFFLTGAALGFFLALAWVRLFTSDASLARALAFSNQGMWQEALERYRSAVHLNPGNVMARYFQASALIDQGKGQDLATAKALLDGVRREAPDYVLLNYKYWLLYNRLGFRAEAHAALARQIELDPLAADFFLERGRQAAEEGRFEEAKVDFEKAVSVEPDNPIGRQYLGNLLVMEGRFQEALAVYATGLARSPESAELHYNAAVAAFKLGDTGLAREHALAVLRIIPDHAQARLILSRLEK